MKVTNKTDHPIIAYGWHRQFGYSEDTLIAVNETADIEGPVICKYKKIRCRVLLVNNITCTKAPDHENFYHVSKGHPLILEESSEDRGVSVRHYEDDAEYVDNIFHGKGKRIKINTPLITALAA